MKPVIFHPGAEFEFDRSVGFYESKVKGLGLDFEQEVISSLSTINEDPQRWPYYKFSLRKYLLTRFPFNIYYLDLPDHIWIVAIAHNSRKPDYWKNRLTNGKISR